MINYWHRKPGFFDGKPGVYYRFPYNPTFCRELRDRFPTLQYKEEWRAFWVPEVSAPEFEQFGLARSIGKPCPRCKRGEACKGWPEDEVESWKKDFESQTAEWFKEQESFWKEQAKEFEDGPQWWWYRDVGKSKQTASWSEEGPKQQTYGRKVDPDFRSKQREQYRTGQKREQANWADVPIFYPPDVLRQAATVLGVKVGASADEIKQATKKLALEHHPDHGGTSSRMAEILAARDVLLGKG